MTSRVNVAPDIDNPTHHISLTDGKITIGLVITNSRGERDARAIRRSPMQRTAMKTTTGNQTYSDMNWPWVTAAQDNFSGGRGSEDFEKDTSKYYDGRRLNVASDKVFLGPQETFMEGLKKGVSNLTGPMSWLSMLAGSQKHLAAKITPTETFTAGQIQIWVRRRGTPLSDLTIRLRQSLNNAPSTILETKTISTNDVTDTISEIRKVTVNQSLTAGNNYWIEVYSETSDDTNYWQVGVASTATTDKQSSDGITWNISSKSMYCRITEANLGKKTRLFSYRYCRYAVQKSGTGAPTVWINGDRGMADANTGALSTLVDATKAWKTNEWVGSIVQIISGKGFDDPQNWRKITENDATTLTVETPWTIEHDTTTEYVILNSNKWYPITGHGLTVIVTDIKVVNNIVYFCQGDDVAMRRMQWNTSTSVHDWADDGTNKAVKLCAIRTDTGLVIWRANNKDASGYVSVSKASVVDWPTNLTFGTAEPMKDDFGRITNMIEYVGPNEYGYEMKMLYIFREGMIFTHNGTNLDTLNLDELKTITDQENGKAAIISNRYMIFSMNKRIEKYYEQNLEDIGPDRGTGFPEERRGSCVDLMAFPARFFAAIDAGDTGYSSVMVNTSGEQWHEIYSAPYGERIQAIAFDTIPGSDSDRLLVAQGDDIIWLCRPSGTLDDLMDTNSRFTHEGVIVSSWINGGFPDIWKLYYTMKLRTKNLAAGEQYIEVDYQVDDQTTWTPMEDAFTLSPVDERKINDEYGENAKQFRFRLRIQTTDNTRTPVLKTVVTELLGLMPIKYGYTFQFRAKENDINLLGEPDDITGEEKLAILDEWASSLTPLFARCVKEFVDNKRLFLNPAPLAPIAVYAEQYIGDLSLVEI